MLMQECKANRGHLMQHWPLCEALAALFGVMTDKDSLLLFIDGHAMKPYSRFTVEDEDEWFGRVRGNLPGQNSRYEQAWHQRVPGDETLYPSSAVFAEQVWGGRLAYLLCEQDVERAEACREWLQSQEDANRAVAIETYPADWRQRFERFAKFPLTRLKRDKATIKEVDPTAIYVSFDPNMVSGHRGVGKRNVYNMYPEDMDKIWIALQPLEHRPAILQIATYSAQDDNDQDHVEQCLTRGCPAGWRGPVVTRTGNDMMCLLFWSNAAAEITLEPLSAQFTEWARGGKKGGKKGRH